MQDPYQHGVLEAVREVLGELGAEDAAARAAPNSSLDRDLGLGSLERVELLMRVEKRFGRRLRDELAQRAETPADLAAALSETSDGGLARLRYTIPTSPPAPAPPAEATDFIEVLRGHAEADPERAQIHLIENDAPRTISYGELERRSSQLASGLIAAGLAPGQTVAIMLPTCADFFYSFLGVSLAGGIAVPIYPPARPKQIGEYVARQLEILRNAEVRFLITFDRARIVADLLRPGLPSLIDVVTADSLLADSGRREELPAPAEIFFIQYTSGSTGNPKGVTLTHANVLANVRGIGWAVQARPDDVVVTWLPLYHDMGLIGSWLFSLYYAFPITVLSPLDFLSRPERWLWALSDAGGTLCPAPNFSFDLCTAKISDEALEDVDLSRWRVAINAGEPVLPTTLEAFARRFEPQGFRPEAYIPCYGLAESSVALTFPPIDRKPLVDTIDRETFEKEGRAVRPSADDRLTLRFVANGKALPGHEVRIVDDQSRNLAERLRGRILFRGPSRTSGYYRNPEASRAVIDAEGWMDSGDLGYRAEGEIFVTGRLKDVIIKSGHNIIPQDVEAAAAEIEGVRKGCIAAFGTPHPETGTERLVVVVETRLTDAAAREQLVHQVVENVTRKVGMPPDVVLPAPPHAVPKTSSGKIRRNETRLLFEAGRIAHRRSAAPWVQVARVWASSLVSRSTAAVRRTAAGTAALLGWVKRWTAAALFALPARIVPATGLAARISRQGLRNLSLVEGSVKALRTKGECAEGPVVFLANRVGPDDPIVLLCALPGDPVLADERGLEPLAGPAALLIDPLLAPADGSADTLGGRIRGALREGHSVIVQADSAIGESAARSRFRLEALQAAAAAGAPVVPVWRTGAEIRLGPARTLNASNLESLRAERDGVRLALARLADTDR